MNNTLTCEEASELVFDFANNRLNSGESDAFSIHLEQCGVCRAKVQRLQAVQGVLHETVGPKAISRNFNETTGQRLQTIAEEAPEEQGFLVASEPVGWKDRFSAAPWWAVSAVLHVLVLALASLISMTIELPKPEDALVTVTELAPAPKAPVIEVKKKEEQRNALESKRDTPPTDPTSKELSEVTVPKEILERAEMGDHFETNNPDRPDTGSAFGNPDAHSFHSATGSDDAEGGGGNGGTGMEDLIGAGGASSPGTGGGWGGGNGAGTGVGTGGGHGSFGSRNGGGRKLMVKKHGGSQATENSVDLALKWLAYHQEADGHWDAQKYGASGKFDTAMTGFALLAFLGAGHTEKVGAYKTNVQRAVAWLISVQDDTGFIAVKGDPHFANPGYPTAIATLALAEATGMANVPATRAAAQKAVNYAIEIHQQGEGSEKGGWRYGRKSATADTSVSGWFIMALKSAKVSGLAVDPAGFEGAIKFLDSVERKNVGQGANSYGPASAYCYTPQTNQGGRDGYTNRTWAIGLLCRQFLGWKKEELQSSVEQMIATFKVPGAKAGSGTDMYYWYYGTLCLFQQGGELWAKWNEHMKKELVDSQCKNGDEAGSWAPDGAYSKGWGRVGQTALSCLCLEVYYRYAQLNR
jgi:hypothetical protein